MKKLNQIHHIVNIYFFHYNINPRKAYKFIYLHFTGKKNFSPTYEIYTRVHNKAHISKIIYETHRKKNLSIYTIVSP